MMHEMWACAGVAYSPASLIVAGDEYLFLLHSQGQCFQRRVGVLKDAGVEAVLEQARALVRLSGLTSLPRWVGDRGWVQVRRT